MGLGSSAYRYRFLESRNTDITRTLSHLSMQKMTMTRESTKLSRDYANAVNSKILKLSYNNGATYLDMSYSNLMSPNVANSNKPIFITDCNSRVVISDNYKKYAEMISKDGAPNSSAYTQGSSIRAQILTGIAGITEEQLNEYDGKSSENTLTAEQKSLIEFYDTLFLTIANNGWNYNAKVSDNDYLSESLQNGYYFLTTYEKEETSNGGFRLTYETDLAVNNTEVYQVSNSSKNDAALAKYEALKSRLSQKETIIDTRMKNLETEFQANKTMMESIKNTMDENIERTMNIFA